MRNVVVIATGYDVADISCTTQKDQYIFNMTFEMVAKVTGALIDDYQLITNKEQSKEFEITFDSVGSGSCMIIDFKDGSVKSYGDKSFCEEWKPDIKYDPVLQGLESPQIISHVY